MTSKKNLVVCFRAAPVEERLIARINEAWGSSLNIVNVGQSDVASALLEADYFCGHAKVPVDWEKIVSLGRLKWIQSSAAGMDWCLEPPVIKSDITITTAAGVLSDQVAEHGLSLILAWGRNLRSFISTSVIPPTSITATPLDNLPIRSLILSASYLFEVRSSLARKVVT